ncbi:hypothetical protein DSL72_001822 [Monilinia vaccinii-corymbosi]|uniref:Uncharacterized protein n=1 Tax=Monilinia vaccinii-corymbosi TaxID=61207 RepID=A0A8A3PAW9_9HELO|nr:hypothetical protein DSL72_001822 [Monilinia vaccinii-corymbosi]
MSPTPNLQQPRAAPNNSVTRPRFWAGSSSKQDDTNSRLSVNASDVSRTGSPKSPTQAQRTREVPGAWSGSEGVSTENHKPDTTNDRSLSATSGVSRPGSSGGLGKFQPTHSESRAGSAFEVVSTGSGGPENMNITQSAVTSHASHKISSEYFGQSHIKHNHTNFGSGFGVILTGSGGPENTNIFPSTITSDESLVEDQMDLDPPSFHNRAITSLVRGVSSLRLAKHAPGSGSGSVAISPRRNGRDYSSRHSWAVATTMRDMRTNHSKVTKRLRKSLQTSSTVQQIVTGVEDLGMCS